MSLRLLVDECLGRDLVRHLRDAGHDVVWIKEAAAHASDRDVMTMCLADQRIVVTDYYDFGDLVFRERMLAVDVVIIASDMFAEATKVRNSLVHYKMSLESRMIPTQDEPEGGLVGHAGDCSFVCKRSRSRA